LTVAPPLKKEKPAPSRTVANPATPPPATPGATIVLVASIPESVAGRPQTSFTLPLRPAVPELPAGPAPAGPGPSPDLAPGLLLPDIGRRFFRVPGNLLHEGWEGASLNTATKLKFPIAFLAVAAVFFLIQGLVDRRDPKLSAAPEHQDEDSVEFE
jgi:hypothetical protein